MFPHAKKKKKKNVHLQIATEMLRNLGPNPKTEPGNHLAVETFSSYI